MKKIFLIAAMAIAGTMCMAQGADILADEYAAKNETFSHARGSGFYWSLTGFQESLDAAPDEAIVSVTYAKELIASGRYKWETFDFVPRFAHKREKDARITELMDKAVELARKNGNNQLIARCLSARSLWLKNTRQAYDDAQEAIAAAKTLKPYENGAISGYYALGSYYLQTADYDKAAQNLREALRIYPHNIDSRKALLESLFAIDTNEAIEEAHQVIECGKTCDPEAFSSFEIKYLIKTSNWPAATDAIFAQMDGNPDHLGQFINDHDEDLEKISEASPTTLALNTKALAKNNSGSVYVARFANTVFSYYLNDPVAALPYAEMVFSLVGQSYLGTYSLVTAGHNLERAGMFSAALKFYDKWVEQCEHLYSVKARLFWSIGEVDSAMATIDKCINANNRVNNRYKYSRAGYERTLGMTAEALADINANISDVYSYADADHYLLRGELLNATGEKDKAKLDFERALTMANDKLSSDNRPTYYDDWTEEEKVNEGFDSVSVASSYRQIALAQLYLGNMAEAETALAEAQKLKADAPATDAMLYSLMDKKNEAMASIRKYVEGGGSEFIVLEKDPRLANVRGEQGFSDLVEQARRNAEIKRSK